MTTREQMDREILQDIKNRREADKYARKQMELEVDEVCETILRAIAQFGADEINKGMERAASRFGLDEHDIKETHV